MKDTLISETSISVDASPAQVWKALTTPKLIKKYLMGTMFPQIGKKAVQLLTTVNTKEKSITIKGLSKK